MRFFALWLVLVFFGQIAYAVGVCVGRGGTQLEVASCRENRDLKELLDLGKLRAQEKYSIEEPETYQELRKLADEKILELNKTYDKDCKKELL